MTNANEDLLITTEGVDEGSADLTVEGPGPGSGDAEGAGLGHCTDPDRPRDEHGGGENRPAPPYVVESPESREAHAADTGQQLAAGEG